jgi:hypothetical protein
MRLLITNLLIAALIVMPLRAWTSQLQCGCEPPRFDVQTGEVIDTCCPLSFDQGGNEPERKPLPCDEQNCPSECCDFSVASSFVLPGSSLLIPALDQIDLAQQVSESECSSPHLLGLKRPPKSA